MIRLLRAVEDHHGPGSSAPQERVHGVADVIDAVLSRAHGEGSWVVQADRRADAEPDEREEGEEEKLTEHCIWDDQMGNYADEWNWLEAADE